MDLLTHIGAGLAIGTGIAVGTKSSALKKTGIILAGALGGALPDIDAISLWSKFDSTFGVLFELQHSGRVIYSGKFWYSHHGFMHSLLASLIFGFLLLLFIYFIRSRFRDISFSSFVQSVKNNRWLLFSFLGGYLAHLLCDMPTPAASWGGVRLFYPFTGYIGGTGKIWWWNNYDIFLIINAVIVVNVLLLILGSVFKRRFRNFSLSILLISIVFILVQINTRGFDFNYRVSSSKQFHQYEVKSKEIQQDILGNKLYTKMKRLDNSILLNF